MKIAHVGCPGFILAALADAERSQGLESAPFGVLAEPFRASIVSPLLSHESQLLEFQPTHLVIHGFLGLSGFGSEAEAMRALSALKSGGTRVIFWAQPHDFHSSNAGQILPHFDAIVSADFLNAELATRDGEQNASPVTQPGGSQRPSLLRTTIPFPVPAGVLTHGAQREYGRIPTERLRILHIPYRAPSATVAAITSALAGSKNASLEIAAPESFNNVQELVERIQSADLVVEALDESSYGIIGALTLAAARPLLSGNSPAWRAAWPAMENCPVIHCCAADLSARIKSLVVEPRTLRDFGKRGRAFAETHHHPAQVARHTAALYRQLLH